MGCRFSSSEKQTGRTSSSANGSELKTQKLVASVQGLAADIADEVEYDFPTLEFEVDFDGIASADGFQDVVDAFSVDISTLSMGLPVQVFFRLFAKTAIFLTDGTDIGAKIKKLLTSKTEKIDDGVKRLTQKDLKTASDELKTILRTSARLIETIENGEDQGSTNRKVSNTIKDLLAQVRSCVHSALDAYNTAGDDTEAIKTKLNATKIAVTAKMAACIRSSEEEGILAESVRDLFVERMNALLSERVLRRDLKQFMKEEKMMALNSETEQVLRIKELVTCFLSCEVFCFLNKLKPLMLDLEDDQRLDLKKLLLAGLFDGATTIEELAEKHFTPHEMLVVAAYLDKSAAELKDLPNQQEFLQQFSVDKTSAAALYRQGCQKDALGDTAGAKDLWEKAAKTACAPVTTVPKQGALQRMLSTKKSPRPAAEGGGAEPPVPTADAAVPAKALVRLGWVSVGAGRHEEARARFAEAAALAPGLATAHYGLGYVLREKLGRLEDGIAAYRRALELDAEYVNVHCNLGVALQAQGDLAEAIASYQRALELDPELAEAHVNLGNVMKAQRDLGGAVASYRRALELDPELAVTHHNLGVTLKAQGDLAGAVASYRRALELDPEYAKAHYNLGLALEDQKDLSGAEAAYRRALEARPDHADALGMLGGLLRKMGGAERLREAEDLLRRAVALDPGSAIKAADLGLVLKQKGDLAEAEWMFRNALEMNPNSTTAKNNLKKLLAAKK